MWLVLKTVFTLEHVCIGKYMWSSKWMLRTNRAFELKVFFQVALNFSKEALFKPFLNNRWSHPGPSVWMPVQEKFGLDFFPWEDLAILFWRIAVVSLWGHLNYWYKAEMSTSLILLNSCSSKGQIGLFKDIKSMHFQAPNICVESSIIQPLGKWSRCSIGILSSASP